MSGLSYGTIHGEFNISTRVSDEALYNQFPWLRKEDMRSRIIDSSRILLDSLVDLDEEDLPPLENNTIPVAKEFLKITCRQDQPLPLDQKA